MSHTPPIAAASRTPEVEVSMKCALTGRLDLDSMGGARLTELREQHPEKTGNEMMLWVLAKEIERLERIRDAAMAMYDRAEAAAETAEARIVELEAQKARLREAIKNCVDWSSGREYEWGKRAENAFDFLHNALAETKGTP